MEFNINHGEEFVYIPVRNTCDMDKVSTAEDNIKNFFDKESTDMKKRHEEEGISESMQNQINALTAAEVNVVLDVGSGPGTLLLELLQKGVPQVIGMDLSKEMNEVARKRLVEHGVGERAALVEGSFQTTEIDHRPDGISMHRVLCCHPDLDGMLEKSATYQPEIITLSVPRDWKVLRFLLGIVGMIAQLRGSFRPYIHTQKSIDTTLEKLGYRKSSQHKGYWWVTTTYQQVQDN